MVTLMIVYFVVSLILTFIFVFTELIPTEKVSLWAKEGVLAVILIALAIGMLFIPTHIQKTEAIGDAVLMEYFEDADLYYDEVNGLYFTVETDKWNPFEMYKRVEVSRALVEIRLNEAVANTEPTK